MSEQRENNSIGLSDPVAKSPLGELIGIAAPVVAAMTSFTLMQFVDRIMVSRIGPEATYVGAQVNGGMLSWVPISIAMGFTSVVNTFVSQNFGAGKPERGAAYVWTAIWMTLAYWLVVLLPIAALMPWIVSLMRDTQLSAEALAQADARDVMAVSYARILLVGAAWMLAARAVGNFFYGMHSPMVVLISTVAGNVTNILGNSLLVFGPVAPRTDYPLINHWFEFTSRLCATLGIPRLGVAGSAWSTICGTLVELLIPMAIFLSPKYRRAYQTARSWRPNVGYFKELFAVGWPGALMFGNEMACWAFFMVYLVGHFGSLHSTAGGIAHQFMSLSFMPTVGISVAMTAMVGKAMGMKRPDIAEQRAWLGVKVAVTYMTICAIVFVVFRKELVGMFLDKDMPVHDRQLIIQLGSAFLIATAAFQFFDGIAMSLSGALRGAGDTRWPGVATLILSWSIIVGGGLAIVRWAPGLESRGPWMTSAAYIITLALALLVRFRSGAWKAITLVRDEAGPSDKPGPAGTAG